MCGAPFFSGLLAYHVEYLRDGVCILLVDMQHDPICVAGIGLLVVQFLLLLLLVHVLGVLTKFACVVRQFFHVAQAHLVLVVDVF